MNLLTDATHHEEESDEYFTEADFDQEVPERDTPTSDSQSHSRPEPRQCAPPTRKQSSLEVPPTVINHEHHHFHDYNTQGYPGEVPEEFHRSAWYKFDPAVLLALISPVGNWLTGGDHVKNLLFLVLPSSGHRRSIVCTLVNINILFNFCGYSTMGAVPESSAP